MMSALSGLRYALQTHSRIHGSFRALHLRHTLLTAAWRLENVLSPHRLPSAVRTFLQLHRSLRRLHGDSASLHTRYFTQRAADSWPRIFRPLPSVVPIATAQRAHQPISALRTRAVHSTAVLAGRGRKQGVTPAQPEKPSADHCATGALEPDARHAESQAGHDPNQQEDGVEPVARLDEANGDGKDDEDLKAPEAKGGAKGVRAPRFRKDPPKWLSPDGKVESMAEAVRKVKRLDRLNKRQREMISLLTIQSAKAVLAHMGDDVEHIKNFYIAAQLYICIAEDDRGEVIKRDIMDPAFHLVLLPNPLLLKAYVRRPERREFGRMVSHAVGRSRSMCLTRIRNLLRLAPRAERARHFEFIRELLMKQMLKFNIAVPETKPKTPLTSDESQSLPTGDELQPPPTSDEPQLLPTSDEPQPPPASDEPEPLPTSNEPQPLPTSDESATTRGDNGQAPNSPKPRRPDHRAHKFKWTPEWDTLLEQTVNEKVLERTMSRRPGKPVLTQSFWTKLSLEMGLTRDHSEPYPTAAACRKRFYELERSRHIVVELEVPMPKKPRERRKSLNEIVEGAFLERHKGSRHSKR